MEFNNYVKKRENQSINEIRSYLTEEISRQIKSAPVNNRECLEKLMESVNKSGGTTFASRYGLKKDIVFSDSELLSAFERGKDAVKYLQYRYDFKYYPLKHKLRDYPLVIAVEASGRCNLRCKMCFQKNMDEQEVPQNKQIMSWNTYKKFISELDEEHLYSIVFASRGEPLLNPNICRMIRLAKQKGVLDIKLNTNGTLMTEEMSRQILGSGLDLLVFSVDSVNPERFKKIRGTDLLPILRNIDQFMEIKEKEFPEARIKVRVAMVLTKEMQEFHEEEIRLAQEYWTGRVDELSIKTENDFASIYIEKDEELNYSVCSLLWERVYLWNDGTVNPCDIDHLSSLNLGNINDGVSIKELWNGEKMDKLRNAHQCNRKNMKNVCSRCIGY